MTARSKSVLPILCLWICLAFRAPWALGADPTLSQRAQDIEDPSARAEWKEYIDRSVKYVRLNRETMVRELQKNNLDRAVWPPAGKSDIPGPGDKPEEWYKSEEAIRLADNVVSFQMPSGGWGKNIDMTTRPREPGERCFRNAKYAGTFHGDATWRETRFLAQVGAATGLSRFRDAFARGLDFVLNAQFPSGGWPLSYPLVGDYRDNIAFRDKAMLRCLEVVRDVARGEGAYRIADEESRRKAAAALEKGLACMLRTQGQDYGFPTAWGVQHDPLTLEPAAGRASEPVGLAVVESAEILRFLMTLDAPSSEIVRAVYGGADWLERTRIEGVRWEKVEDDLRLAVDPLAPPAWARFYERGTNRPIFAGSDGVVRYNVAEIDRESRNRYEWYDTEAPASALREFADWRPTHPRP